MDKSLPFHLAKILWTINGANLARWKVMTMERGSFLFKLYIWRLKCSIPGNLRVVWIAKSLVTLFHLCPLKNKMKEKPTEQVGDVNKEQKMSNEAPLSLLQPQGYTSVNVSPPNETVRLELNPIGSSLRSQGLVPFNSSSIEKMQMRSTPMRNSVSDQALEDTIEGVWEIGEPSALSPKWKDSEHSDGQCYTTVH